MKLIEPNVELIPQGEGILGVYKQIEVAGRTCYKSEDKITTNSATDFVAKMINSGHTAMLEHGTVYLNIPAEPLNPEAFELVNSPYSQVEYVPGSGINCVTTNLRVIIENDWLELLKLLAVPSKFHPKRITARFTCDRGVSHELVRHRVFSFAQESTRYCNYSKDKFGNQLTYIIPQNLELNEGEYKRELTDTGFEITGDGFFFESKDGFDDESLFIYHLLTCEHRYFAFLDMGWKPQQARAILPNALKTEVVMTGFLSDWEHFFELRCASNAHPDMQFLANKLKELFISKSYI